MRPGRGVRAPPTRSGPTLWDQHMGKPKADHTTPELPPLEDDAHWLPISVARQRRVDQTGDAAFAMIDLTDALEQGRLRCMIRSAAGERRRVAATAWSYRFILSFGTDGLRVLQRRPDIVEPVQGDFYIWEPDLETG